MMKQFIFIFWIFFSFSIFQNGYVSACVLCKFGSIVTTRNTSIIKSNTDRPKPPATIPNSIYVQTRKHHHIENDLLISIKTVEDLIQFNSQISLANLSMNEKRSFIITLTSFYGHMTAPMPHAISINLMKMLACSPKLFFTISQECLNSILSELAFNQCTLYEIPTEDIVPFLNGLLSLSPGVLNKIPRASFISTLGLVSSPEILSNLTHSSVINLITVLSMSKSTVNCLQLPTLFSLLTFIASKSLMETTIKLPPSTVFGFLEGLLVTLDESSPFLVNVIPTSVLVAIFKPIMTSRMLSTIPIINFDLLLSVLGSSQLLIRDLPISNFISTFNILITSPKILSSLNPNNVAKLLSTVATCPTLLDFLPSPLKRQLLDSITVYLPSSLACISSDEFLLLFGESN
ncbi:uncharacterized protein LOC112600186 [Melanaphis sacchari]|uniref:uncharacterized protein LOC112600186 n=1 Tax=Melanaphis sacchari TaxID=742174 RepID=UPI000DC12EEB|nr:uncharacterized protein LOC112600186 [Melanaphis sacchari]